MRSSEPFTVRSSNQVSVNAQRERRGTSMTEIREATKADTAECGRIIYDAFAAIAGEHNFLPDFRSVEVATGVASMLIENPGFNGVVAEDNGRIVGSNFACADPKP
jgi:hypothetical protein